MNAKVIVPSKFERAVADYNKARDAKMKALADYEAARRELLTEGAANLSITFKQLCQKIAARNCPKDVGLAILHVKNRMEAKR